MTRFLIIPFIVFIYLTTSASAQVIDLDEEEVTLAVQYKKSTMYYFTPDAYDLQMGYSHMNQILGNELGINPKRLMRLIGFGIGWRRNITFYNFHAAFPVFPNNTVNNSSSRKTIVNHSTSQAELTIGRAVLTTDRRYLILKGGLGFYGNELQVRQYTSDGFDLDNPILGQGTAWPLLQHYSGTFNIALEFVPKPMRPLSVMPSFQLGYKGSIGSPNWRSPDALLSNTVADRLDMLYMRISLVVSRQQ